MSSLLQGLLAQLLAKKSIGEIVSLRVFTAGEGPVELLMGGIWRILEIIFPNPSGKLSASRQSDPTLLTLLGQLDGGATFNLTSVASKSMDSASNDLLVIGHLGIARLEGLEPIVPLELPDSVQQAIAHSLSSTGNARFGNN